MEHGLLGNGGDNGVCYSYNATTTTALLLRRCHLPGRRHQVPRPALTTAADRSGYHHCGHKHEGEVEEDEYHAATRHRCPRGGTTTFASEDTIYQPVRRLVSTATVLGKLGNVCASLPTTKHMLTNLY